MYPDTDLPPLAITEERIERIRSILAELPWERQKRYEDMGLDRETARRMSISKRRGAFDDSVSNTKYEPDMIAELLLNGLRRLRRREGVTVCGDGIFVETLVEADRKSLPATSLEVLLTDTCGENGAEPAKACDSFEILDGKKLERKMKEYAGSLDIPEIDEDKLISHLTGRMVERFRGYITRREAFEFASRYVASR
jgi:Glu-tRNA(Gln) amidotransferase subunit E-like FAD-binding protein